MAAPAVLLPARTRFEPGRLLAARQASGLTLRDVAAATGWHHSTPHRYESGDVDPPAGALALLASLYGVLPGDLFTPVTDQA